MSEGFVYRWTDNSNGMYYIGCHKGDPNDGYIGSGKWFKSAYDKRPESFSREVLYVGEHFAELEEFMLIELDASRDEKSYNLINACRGQNEFSSEARERISKAHKGKVTSEETKIKMSLASKGRPKSKKHKDSISKVLKGVTGKDARRNVAIYSEVLDREFYSQKHACEELGIGRTYIWSCLTGKNKNEKYKLKKVKR